MPEQVLGKQKECGENMEIPPSEGRTVSLVPSLSLYSSQVNCMLVYSLRVHMTEIGGCN